jgi:hypothetical protein
MREALLKLRRRFPSYGSIDKKLLFFQPSELEFELDVFGSGVGAGWADCALEVGVGFELSASARARDTQVAGDRLFDCR